MRSRYLAALLHYATLWWKYGRHCPYCGEYFAGFLSGGFHFPVLQEKRVVGGGRRSQHGCPCCGSTDRERALFFFLKDRLDSYGGAGKLRMLHVAPEKNLRNFLSAHPAIEYLDAGLDSPTARVKLDITNIPYGDETFDVIVCNHVLEHVQDDIRAMAELYRVLKAGGWAVLQVPIALSLDRTYEDDAISEPEQRERAFGQSDHVRIYGRDYKTRLESAGFAVEARKLKDRYGDRFAEKHGLIPEEGIYCCTKKAGPAGAGAPSHWAKA